MELINDIPRLYTGLAEWAGCLVVLLNCRRKVQTAPFIAISAAAVFIQCGFLMITADIGAGIVWILVMTAAFFLMCLYIFLCGGITAKGAVYGAAAAFLHAEFAASLEWQLHFWLLKHIPVGTPFSVLLLATVYLIVFSLFYYLLKRHITEEYIRSLTWKEVTSISRISVFRAGPGGYIRDPHAGGRLWNCCLLGVSDQYFRTSYSKRTVCDAPCPEQPV